MFASGLSNDGESLLVYTTRDCNPEHLLSISTNFQVPFNLSLPHFFFFFFFLNPPQDFEAGKADSVELTPVVDDWIGSFSYLHNFGNLFLFMSNFKAEVNIFYSAFFFFFFFFF